MPTYEYHCQACESSHEEFRLITEPGPKKCPTCKAKPPLFSQVYHGANPVAIVRGNPKTVGQQAEENAKRLGKEQMQIMAEAERKRVRKYTGPMPKGAKINTTGTGETPPWRDGSMGGPKLDKPLDVTKIKYKKKFIETGETK